LIPPLLPTVVQLWRLLYHNFFESQGIFDNYEYSLAGLQDLRGFMEEPRRAGISLRSRLEILVWDLSGEVRKQVPDI
jgi:hypothetical protein